VALNGQVNQGVAEIVKLTKSILTPKTLEFLKKHKSFSKNELLILFFSSKYFNDLFWNFCAGIFRQRFFIQAGFLLLSYETVNINITSCEISAL
jgi:hypothetical protein